MPASLIWFREDEPLDQGLEPDTAERKTTDCPCCLFFVLCLVGLGYVVNFAFAYGSPRRFTGLPDYAGNACGISGSVADKPYLYFCEDVYHSFDRRNRICIDSCPMHATSDIFLECPGGTSQAYPTTVYGGTLCMPSGDMPMDAQRRRDLFMEFLKDPKVIFFLELGELVRLWPLMVIVALASILSGFLYLFLLQSNAKFVVFIGLATVILSTSGLGAYLIYQSENYGTDHIQYTGDGVRDWCVGAFLISLSILIAFVGCYQQKNMPLALGCVKAACECIWDMPTLLFEPFLALSLKVSVAGFLLYSLMHLLTITETSRGFEKYAHHASYHLHYWFSYQQSSIIAAYVFMSWWILEILSALSHFVVAYSTQLWFFADMLPGPRWSKRTASWATCRAYAVGLTYHLGTLAMGSLIIIIARPLRILTGWFACASYDNNPVSTCVGCAFGCCVACYEQTLKYLSKVAYIDVAVNSIGFCQAAYHAMAVLENDATVVINLVGATFLIQLAGVCGIASMGGVATYVTIVNFPSFSDPFSVYYIYDPVFAALISSVLCGMVATPFMLLLDQVSDTILFCWALEKKRLLQKPTVTRVEEGMLNSVSCMYRTPSRSSDDAIHIESSSKNHPPETHALLQNTVANKYSPSKSDPARRRC